MARACLPLWLAMGALFALARPGSAADAQARGAPSPDPTAPNKALVRRWIEEGFNGRSLAVVDEVFAERFAVNGNVVGRDGLKRSMSRHIAAFPDLHVIIDEIVAEGGKVALWYTVEGTHRGEFDSARRSLRPLNARAADRPRLCGSRVGRKR